MCNVSDNRQSLFLDYNKDAGKQKPRSRSIEKFYLDPRRNIRLYAKRQKRILALHCDLKNKIIYSTTAIIFSSGATTRNT